MKNFLMILACVIATAIYPAGSSRAATVPLSGLEGLGRPVADEELADMRGKFVSPSGISYFGIAMASSWQDSDGITTSATLLFSINLAAAGGSGTPIPHIMVSWSRDCPSCGDSSMDVAAFGPEASVGYVALTGQGVSIPVGALDAMTGVVQTQQIAGSDNLGRNGMTIQIVPASLISEDLTGMTAITGPGGETRQFADGDTIQFAYSNQGLELTMTDQNGALRQGVDGNLGQLAQHLLIVGVDNVVGNNMNLTIGIDPAAAAQQLNIQNALATMKGQGF